MLAYNVLVPSVMTINALTLKDAIKNYIRMNRRRKISYMIIKDQHNHYKAHMKYFKKNHRINVGINIFPYIAPPDVFSTPVAQITSPIISPVVSPIAPVFSPIIPSIQINERT